MIKDQKMLATIVPESQPDPYADQPGYKQCVQCKEWKYKNQFYKQHQTHTTVRCKPCILGIEKIKRDKEKEEKLVENWGSSRVLLKPNHFTDKYQKEHTHEFLKVIGWIQDPQTNKWYKPGIKEQDGTWSVANKTSDERKILYTKKNIQLSN